MSTSNLSALPEEASSCRLGETRDLYQLEYAEENHRALAYLLSQCRHSIEIFSHSLDHRIFDHQDVLDAIKDLAVNQSRASIRILVRDPQPMVNDGHRILELMRRLSSYIEIRKTHANYAETRRMFVLADEQGYLYKESDERYEGVACFYDPMQAREWHRYFSEVWEHSDPVSDFRRLHI